MSNDFMNKLVTFIHATHFDNLPEEMKQVAKQAIIDTIAVSLAGWENPAVDIVKKTYGNADEQRQGRSSLWGEPLQITAEYAALINGTASHVLDYDDVSTSAWAHPSVPILAAVLPLAEQEGCSGKEVIAAYVIGTEVMIRLGKVMGFRHYKLGWHATDTLGTVGAAAACAYLLKLNAEQTTNCIGLAASMSGGLQKNFGTMTKPLHVGIAGSHAIQSALLARNGLTANPEALGPNGFFYALSGGETDVNQADENIRFGEPFDLMDIGLVVKKFPCCYSAHRFIQGALEIKQEQGLSLDEIKEIVLTAPADGFIPLIHHRPVTGLQGKFSAEYTTLTALADGYVQLNTFEDEQVMRENIQQSFDKVKLKLIEGVIKDPLEVVNTPVVVQIKTTNGQTYERTVLHVPGSKESPITLDELRLKWCDCLFLFMRQRSSAAGFEQLEQRVNRLFDKGLVLESCSLFSEWISDIHAFISSPNR